MFLFRLPFKRGAFSPPKLVNAERNVLRVALVEHPHLSVLGGPGDAVAVVVEEEAVGLGVAAHLDAGGAHLLEGGVETGPVLGAGLPLQVLKLEGCEGYVFTCCVIRVLII